MPELLVGQPVLVSIDHQIAGYIAELTPAPGNTLLPWLGDDPRAGGQG